MAELWSSQVLMHLKFKNEKKKTGEGCAQFFFRGKKRCKTKLQYKTFIEMKKVICKGITDSNRCQNVLSILWHEVYNI